MSCGKRYYQVGKDGLLLPVESPLVLLSENAAQGAVLVDGSMRFNAKTATPEQKEAWVYKTFQRISRQYDLMNDLESLGLHRAWKHTLVRAVNALEPSTVLDVACGTGDIALEIAKTNPQVQVIGLDFSQNMLDIARKRADSYASSVSVDNPALSNLDLTHGSALDLPFDDESFDVVTISFGLRNMPDYRLSLEEMKRVLRPGGSFFCLEASYPTAPIVAPVFKVYFRHLMPLMANLVTRKPAEYQWLNDSTEAFLSKEQLAMLMEQCGLIEVRYRSFAFGAAALHSGIKP